jgi:VWFA-related protein
VAFALAVMGGLAYSQQAQPPMLSVTTELVTLPVTVVDRHGELVAGLTREQFVIHDNGRPQAIEFFSNEDLPAAVGLVIDSSGSMRARRADVTRAAAAFAATSHPLGQFFTVNFNERVWLGLAPELAFTADRGQLAAAVGSAPTRGMTALYDAIHAALDHLELGSLHRRALVIVSDGGDNASAHTLGSVLDSARQSGAALYTVALPDPDDRTARPRDLRTLADETGGRAFTPRRPEEITAAFVEIAREIRSAYMIGFSPSENAREGFHSIRVTVDAGEGPPLIARTRAGYYAR